MIQKVFRLKCYPKAVDMLSKMSTAIVSNTFTKMVLLLTITSAYDARLTGSGPCKPFLIF